MEWYDRLNKGARDLPGSWGSRCNSCIDHSYPERCITVGMEKIPFLEENKHFSISLLGESVLGTLEDAAGGGNRAKSAGKALDFPFFFKARSEGVRCLPCEKPNKERGLDGFRCPWGPVGL